MPHCPIPAWGKSPLDTHCHALQPLRGTHSQARHPPPTAHDLVWWGIPQSLAPAGDEVPGLEFVALGASWAQQSERRW